MSERARSLFSHRDFVRLWTAETISQFGTQVTFLALPLIAATTLNVTPFEFGLLATIEFLPFILLSLPAGVWVDRLRRRPILIVGDLVRAASLASIPIAFAIQTATGTQILTIWQLYAVGFINGCATVFFDVAYQSYLPALVERDQIVDGNAKLETSRSAAQITGPGIAGVLIGMLTAPFAILIDSLSFLVSALFIVTIRRHEPAPVARVDDRGNRPSMRTEIGEGLRYVGGHRYLRSIAATTGTSNFFSNVAFSILVLYLVRDLGFSPQVLGLAFSLGAIGFLIGALIANRVATRFGVGPTIVGAAVIFGPAALLVAIAPRELAPAFVAASGFIGGLGGAIYNINQVSLRQAITPERMQGRMNATMRFIVWGTIPFGSIAGGFLGGLVGLHETIWIGAIGGLFSFVPVLLSPVREIREMPAPFVE
ncbi:MAG TPA: MFS transporter [Patescibacteria group bacterium]|nr:MFS transporter [Patescibacteria group bacterium]